MSLDKFLSKGLDPNYYKNKRFVKKFNMYYFKELRLRDISIGIEYHLDGSWDSKLAIASWNPETGNIDISPKHIVLNKKTNKQNTIEEMVKHINKVFLTEFICMIIATKEFEKILCKHKSFKNKCAPKAIVTEMIKNNNKN